MVGYLLKIITVFALIIITPGTLINIVDNFSLKGACTLIKIFSTGGGVYWRRPLIGENTFKSFESVSSFFGQEVEQFGFQKTRNALTIPLKFRRSRRAILLKYLSFFSRSDFF